LKESYNWNIAESSIKHHQTNKPWKKVDPFWKYFFTIIIIIIIIIIITITIWLLCFKDSFMFICFQLLVL
jgi:membrane protein YdbS with pleckstrin-like domain